MSQLISITKRGSSPQWKARVYFCAHPEDHKKYLYEVSREILDLQSCAIWHLEDAYGEIDTDDLTDMQLFVVPVTKKLLTTPNRALDIEMPFATERRISILPIIVENDPELFELVNNRWDSIQVLNKFDMDIMAEPYVEKLRKHLKKVLYDDNMVADVRKNAFNSHLFLSYRKKDKKHARELMHLIHKDEKNRRVGIWYDEFLTPGENFNTEIEKEIKDCDIFLLAVTPNLLEKGNYVHEKEFKMAKDEHKLIFSAEMVKTDREAFTDMYKDVGDVTEIENEDEFTSQFRSKLTQIKTCESTPENDFYLGLAYLNGIHVEVDYDKALTYLERASELHNQVAGWAMQQIITMYESGKGVERDYHKAFEWNCRLLDHYKLQLFEMHNCSYEERHANGENYALAFMSCIMSYDTVSDQKLVKKIDQIWNDNIETVKKLVLDKPDEENTEIVRHLSAAYSAYAHICYRNGNKELALELHNEGLEYTNILQDSPSVFDVLMYVSALLQRANDISNTDKEEAIEQFKNIYNLLEPLKPTDAMEEIVVVSGKFMACNSIVRLLTSYGFDVSRVDEAKIWLERAKKLTLDVDDGVLENKSMAMLLNTEGQLLKAEGKTDEAIEKFNQTYQFREEVIQDSNEFYSKRIAIADLIEIGMTTYYNNPNNCVEAANYLRDAISQCEAILKESDNQLITRDLSIAYIYHGVCISKGNPKRAIEQINKGVGIIESLPDEQMRDLDALLQAYTMLQYIYYHYVRKRTEWKKTALKLLEVCDRILAIEPDHANANEAKKKVKKELVYWV